MHGPQNVKSVCQYWNYIFLYRFRTQAYYSSCTIDVHNSLLSHMFQILSISLLVFTTVCPKPP
jgi:uncharacterized membrane protein